MVLFLALAVFLLTSTLLVAAVFAWLVLRSYVLQIFVSYRSDHIRLGLEIASRSRQLLAAALHNEGRQWHAGVQTRSRSLWQRSWTFPAEIPWSRIWRRARSLWKHAQRSAWGEASRDLLEDVYNQLTLREVALNVRLGLPTYPQTGYLAAVAYPLNFTLLRALGVFRAQIIPDFSTRGLAIENQIRCTFRGYQLLKPSYHFLRRPEVRTVLWSRLTAGFRRLVGRAAH